VGAHVIVAQQLGMPADAAAGEDVLTAPAMARERRCTRFSAGRSGRSACRSLDRPRPRFQSWKDGLHVRGPHPRPRRVPTPLRLLPDSIGDPASPRCSHPMRAARLLALPALNDQRTSELSRPALRAAAHCGRWRHSQPMASRWPDRAEARIPSKMATPCSASPGGHAYGARPSIASAKPSSSACSVLICG
jgi:hypothetical protein